MQLLLIVLMLFLPASLAAQPTGQQPANDSLQGNGPTPSGGPEADEKLLRIGVRRDAPPFSYISRPKPRQQPSLTAKSGPLRAQGFDGYMIYICDEVLKLLMIPEGDAPLLEYDQIRHVVIEDEMAQLPPGTDRLSLLEADRVDILCDPATISRDRVRGFASSPPLFLTGISFLMRRGDVEPRSICGTRKALIAAVGTTNAIEYGVTAILDAGAWPKKRDEIVNALRNRNSPRYKNPCGPQHEGAIWQAPNHSAAAKAFCDGEVTYYVGDLEIIRDSIRGYPGCTASSGVQRFTTDRYAIFANMRYDRTDSWKSLIIARFYEVLNREVITSDSLLDRAYSATFGAAPRSEQLELFYWSLRGIP